MKMCSACLLGIQCRFDGTGKANKKIIALSKKETLLPICPEQLGGLPTPRERAERRGDGVYTESGKDVTEFFEQGAQAALYIVRHLGITEAIVKQYSPSCGYGKIYDGTFSGKTMVGDGVAASLLKKSGVKIFTEEDL